METAPVYHQSLTKYPSGSLRELIYLAIPLILSLFSTSFMGFCDRLFLAHYSIESLEASVIAGYLCSLFQQPLIRITSMVQVFVGFYNASNRSHQIGQSIWQMLWFSFFSMVITVPAGLLIAPYFFEGTAIKDSASSYFFTQMGINFLFPLGAGLSSFFIGQGKTRIIFFTTLFAHVFNIGLDQIFIFGIKGYFPSLGVFGASLATCIAQTIYCISLFAVFFNKENRTHFKTTNFHFKWDIFKEQMKISVPRAIARIVLLTAWAATAHLMTMKGNEYLIVLSIGGSLIVLFTFINDGMGQALITIGSHLIGSKNYEKIWSMVRSALILLLSTTAILALPYLLFPNFVLSFFFTKMPSQEIVTILHHSCIWLWLYFLCYGYNVIGFSLVTAARDVTFYMMIITLVWFTSYIPAYLAINVWNWHADKLWLIMALDCFTIGTIFFIRSTREKWKEKASLELQTNI